EAGLRRARRPCASTARTRRSKQSRTAENTKPPIPLVGDTRPRPRLPNPWKPTMPGPATGLFPTCPVLKGKPGTADGLRVRVAVTPGPTRLAPEVGVVYDTVPVPKKLVCGMMPRWNHH